MATDLEACLGCGALLEPIDGPVHAYMLSSPACWAAFNAVTAREYASPDLMAVHRLTVDAWAVQHPGDGSRRAIQSVGLHLARLMVQFENGLVGRAANDAMLRFATAKSSLPELPARHGYSVTVADVVDSIEPAAHKAGVRRWAEQTWNDWADQHAFIRAWASAALR